MIQEGRDEKGGSVDAIINLTHLKFYEITMHAALAARTHYVDTASSTAFLEHWISGDEPKLHREFVDIGKMASPVSSHVVDLYVFSTAWIAVRNGYD